MFIVQSNPFSAEKKKYIVNCKRLLMATPGVHRILLRISLFPLIFVLQLSWLQINSLAYTVPDKYFINCGSDSNVPEHLTDRVFVGDSSGSFFSSKHTSTVKEDDNQSSVTAPLYQSARVSEKQFSYNFDIVATGIHFLRLHFLAFSSSSRNLSTALFNVSVQGFRLLQNFSAKNYTHSPLVVEFLVNVNRSCFGISFQPSESSFAFVNAIELFLLPNCFIQDESPYITPKGNMSHHYYGMRSRVLQKNLRLNVGGGNVTIDKDDLHRNWEADDDYFLGPKSVNNSNSSSKLTYKGEEDSNCTYNVATRFIAPDSVYQTDRQIDIDSEDKPQLFNMTWELRVKRNANHLVRLHFCDNSLSFGLARFNLYIFSNFSRSITAGDYVSQTYAPFYLDFVVLSDDSGFLNISIGLDDSDDYRAYLNGLEVMEIVDDAEGLNLKEECNKQNDLRLGLWLPIGALVVICIFAVLVFLSLKFRKSNPDSDWWPLPINGGGSSHGRRGSSHGSSLPELNLGLKITFAELQLATKNFNPKCMIGKGGFGIVYKGVLKNGTKVAVKRSQPGSGQGLPEFQREITILSRIRHRHLVSLIGYCDEKSEMILVYEFMERGTLRDHLSNTNSPSLSWKQRLEICIDAARGLQYLHKGAAGGIIHRDVKSTNILLDENLVAKVADFGLSRPGPLDEQQSYVITGVKGTFGYLDPAYFTTQELTEKSDVYSFGVVLLEVLCARPAIDPTRPRDEVLLAEWGIFCKNKGTLAEIIDPSIKDQIDLNSLRKFSETVGKCLEDDGSDRPSMADVLWDLEYALQLQRGARKGWPNGDSSSGASASIEMSNIRRLPSLSTLGENDDMPILRDFESEISEHSVFSQLNVDHGK